MQAVILGTCRTRHRIRGSQRNVPTNSKIQVWPARSQSGAAGSCFPGRTRCGCGCRLRPMSCCCRGFDAPPRWRCVRSQGDPRREAGLAWLPWRSSAVLADIVGPDVATVADHRAFRIEDGAFRSGFGGLFVFAALELTLLPAISSGWSRMGMATSIPSVCRVSSSDKGIRTDVGPTWTGSCGRRQRR